MNVSFYGLVWQGVLMLLAGALSVVAAFAGYIQSGGGEELLRRSLANLETGSAQFDNIDFHLWREGKMVVTNLRHNDFKWPKQNPIARFSGLHADEMDVQANLLPWPPRVTGLTVRGMHDTAITLSDGFLQSGLVQNLKAKGVPAIQFEDCDLKLTIGDLDPLLLTGCSGVLRRDAHPADAGDPPLRGSFSLSKLNGRPFDFKLESLEDGRWVLTGHDIQIDTAETLRAQKNPFSGKLDPVGLLVRALFSGEMGAQGTVSSLRIVVQPASAGRPFSCDGEVGYRNLELRLPPASEPTGKALPYLFGQLLGADRELDGSPWPRWMQVDRIRTGGDGRVTFHMTGGVLNFACDEGPGSSFTGILGDREFPPLEDLKGSVETDPAGQMRRITLRGFLGDQLSFETRVERAADQSRTYELVLEPRAGSAEAVAFGRPLWRFVSRARDYFAQKKADGSPLADFELEGDARHFPIANWLPPGMRDLFGHVYVKGEFTGGLKLKFSAVAIDDGATLLYGRENTPSAEEKNSELAPLWKALQALFATAEPWKLRDVALRGQAELSFFPELTATFSNFTLSSGALAYAGLTTNLAAAHPQFNAVYRQGGVSEIHVVTALPGQWQVALEGQWPEAGNKPGTAVFTLRETDVPLSLHPQREALDPRFISPGKRVNRVTTVTVDETGKLSARVAP